MWPTPRANECGQNLHWPEKGYALSAAVKLWPTPAARDWKNGKSNLHGMNARPLNEVVTLAENGGSLNPNWVEWLQGYPPGWTDISTPSQTFPASPPAFPTEPPD
jgi:hypothetical protein